MRLPDLLSMLAICVVWALNAVLMRYAIVDLAVPPLFLAALRFLLAAVLLAPLLRPLPAALLPTIAVGLLLGAGHFGFLFLGFRKVEAASAAIVLQVGIPLTALLSAAILRERIGPTRVAGIALALAGVLIVLWRPGGPSAGTGETLVLLSAASLSLGSVLLKRLGSDVTALRLQAWTAASSIVPLGFLSMVFETGQREAVFRAPAALAAVVAFSAIVVTVMSHTAYFRLLRRYDASLVVPLTLMFPVFTVALGAMLLGERPGWSFLVGGALVMLGVLAVVRRPAPVPAVG